jgi:hypothetical protein
MVRVNFYIPWRSVLAFQSFNFECIWWSLFQKHVVSIRLDIYVVIVVGNWCTQHRPAKTDIPGKGTNYVLIVVENWSTQHRPAKTDIPGKVTNYVLIVVGNWSTQHRPAKTDIPGKVTNYVLIVVENW